jgi:hypothetical protein
MLCIYLFNFFLLFITLHINLVTLHSQTIFNIVRFTGCLYDIFTCFRYSQAKSYETIFLVEYIVFSYLFIIIYIFLSVSFVTLASKMVIYFSLYISSFYVFYLFFISVFYEARKNVRGGEIGNNFKCASNHKSTCFSLN